MKISTSTFDILEHYGDAEGVRVFAEAGFQALDFGMFYSIDDYRMKFTDAERVQYYTNLRKVAEDFGIEVYQTHSPMHPYLFTGDEKPGNQWLDAQIHAIHASSLMGAKYIVIHPVIPPEYRYDHFREETREINYKYYSQLRPYAEEYGVKIAVENMFNWDPEKECICPTVCSSAKEMKDYVDMMGRDWFCNCLDTGHTQLVGLTPHDMIRELGDYIEILHLHDNDGISDLHQIAHTGITDWDALCQALKEIGYKGTFNFEADCFARQFGPRLFKDAARMLYATGRDLVDHHKL